MIVQEELLVKTETAFQEEVMGFVRQAMESEEVRVDEVERGLFDRLLVVGRQALAAIITSAGDGNHGETVEHAGKVLQRSEEKKTKRYRSIFGVLSVERYLYSPGSKKKVEWAPVDAQLGLPTGEQTYVLEDWMQRVCVKESFEEGVGSLRDLLGVTTSVRAAEVMNRRMAEYADSFSETKSAPAADTEEEIIVLAADGKGVPMRRPLEERLKAHQATATSGECPCQSAVSADECPAEPKKKRLQRGEKRTRKQMAYVGAVYSIAPFVRTADECNRPPAPDNGQAGQKGGLG